MGARQSVHVYVEQVVGPHLALNCCMALFRDSISNIRGGGTMIIHGHWHYSFPPAPLHPPTHAILIIMAPANLLHTS